MFLSDEKLKLNDIHQEKGSSIWLSTLPLKKKRYYLNWPFKKTRVLGAFMQLKRMYNKLCLAKKVVL